MPIEIASSSDEQRITAVNRAFTQISGYAEAEALGQRPSLLASGQHDSAFYAAMWHSLAANGHWQGEIWNRRKNGELYPEWLTISAVRNAEDRVTHFVGVFADISSLKHAQARSVSLVLDRRPDQLRVIVEDDGIGFDPNALSQASRGNLDDHVGRRRLGLSGVRERLALIGGTMTIESDRGIGTTLFIVVPVAPSGAKLEA